MRLCVFDVGPNASDAANANARASNKNTITQYASYTPFWHLRSHAKRIGRTNWQSVQCAWVVYLCMYIRNQATCLRRNWLGEKTLQKLHNFNTTTNITRTRCKKVYSSIAAAMPAQVLLIVIKCVRFLYAHWLGIQTQVPDDKFTPCTLHGATLSPPFRNNVM